MKPTQQDKFVFEISDFQKYSGSELKNLLLENKLLVLRNATLDHSAFNSFAEFFGEPEIAYPYKFQSPGFPTIRLQSNVPGAGMDGGGRYWHSDGPQSEEPSRITLLLCAEAPLVGGETAFCNLCKAYSDLPNDVKSKIEDLKGNYPCRQIYIDDLNQMGLIPEEDVIANLKNLKHPLVKTHPLSKNKALYLNEDWLKGIDGLSQNESDELLTYLYKFSTQDCYLYFHKWQKHDLLVWDNYSLMHKALKVDPQYPKSTKRIRIKG